MSSEANLRQKYELLREKKRKALEAKKLKQARDQAGNTGNQPQEGTPSAMPHSHKPPASSQKTALQRAQETLQREKLKQSAGAPPKRPSQRPLPPLSNTSGAPGSLKAGPAHAKPAPRDSAKPLFKRPGVKRKAHAIKNEEKVAEAALESGLEEFKRSVWVGDFPPEAENNEIMYALARYGRIDQIRRQEGDAFALVVYSEKPSAVKMLQAYSEGEPVIIGGVAARVEKAPEPVGAANQSLRGGPEASSGGGSASFASTGEARRSLVVYDDDWL
mmetsp:Transcript_11215/g.41083  ORF Transcript_11215/g.41083 Transcript_11215/m.41083 type:complete len:274 (+) Transcript_11215:117-938(+)